MIPIKKQLESLHGAFTYVRCNRKPEHERGIGMTAEEVVSKLDGARRSSSGWTSRCPAHADSSPSLSIREGNDGRVLLHCFSGCSTADICSALHITVRDLFPGRLDPAQARVSRERRVRQERIRGRVEQLHGLNRDIHRKAEAVIAAGCLGPSGSALAVQDRDCLLVTISDAHHVLRQEMGEQAYAEWSSCLGGSYRQFGAGQD